jgi:hypothetical protein
MLIPLTWLRVVVPVEQAIVLLVPAIAACALAAWWHGGRAALPIVWVVLAAWTLSRPVTGSTPGFDALARGWSLVVAAGFGAVVCFARARTFFGRAVGAVAVALVVGLGVMLATGGDRLDDTVSAELAMRTDRVVDNFRAGISSPPLSAVFARLATPEVATAGFRQIMEGVVRAAVIVFPALLALETIAVLALAWALFHRLSRVRVGAPLAPLREFRFNDQLVWGILLGATVVMLPTLVGFSAAGWNLLVFFGTLYAVRGLGVVTWFMSPGRLAVATVVAVLLATVVTLLLSVPLARVLVLALTVGVLAMGIGIGDTWVDWRGRARTTT